MAGSYNADQRMSKWSLKFVCQYFVMIATQTCPNRTMARLNRQVVVLDHLNNR